MPGPELAVTPEGCEVFPEPLQCARLGLSLGEARGSQGWALPPGCFAVSGKGTWGEPGSSPGRKWKW